MTSWMTSSQRSSFCVGGFALLFCFIGVITFWSGVFTFQRMSYDSYLEDLAVYKADKSCSGRPSNWPLTKSQTVANAVSCLSAFKATLGNSSDPSYIQNEEIRSHALTDCKLKLDFANFSYTLFGILIVAAGIITVYATAKASTTALYIVGILHAVNFSWLFNQYSSLVQARTVMLNFVDCSQFNSEAYNKYISSSDLFCKVTCGGTSFEHTKAQITATSNSLAGFWMILIALSACVAVNILDWSSVYAKAPSSASSSTSSASSSSSSEAMIPPYHPVPSAISQDFGNANMSSFAQPMYQPSAI